MTVPTGKIILIGARRYKAGSEIPDKIAKKAGLDVSKTATTDTTTAKSTATTTEASS